MTNSTKKVLLLDDDFESMSRVKFHLERNNSLPIEVELTASETILKKIGVTHYDLICIDLMINPHSLDEHQDVVKNVQFENVNWQLTGVEFLRRLRNGAYSTTDEKSTSPSVPVVVISAVSSEGIGPLKVTRYVEKPFALEELLEEINNILESLNGENK